MSKVYVRWYGKILEGQLVENRPTGSILDKMLAVQITIQGMMATALFMPAHVYGTEDEARGKDEHHKTMMEAEPLRRTSQPHPLSTTAHPSAAWQGIQEYKKAHWDVEHNRLDVEALEEFYTLWRNAVAAKVGHQPQPVACEPIRNHRIQPTPHKKRNIPKQLSLFD